MEAFDPEEMLALLESGDREPIGPVRASNDGATVTLLAPVLIRWN